VVWLAIGLFYAIRLELWLPYRSIVGKAHLDDLANPGWTIEHVLVATDLSGHGSVFFVVNLADDQGHVGDALIGVINTDQMIKRIAMKNIPLSRSTSSVERMVAAGKFLGFSRNLATPPGQRRWADISTPASTLMALRPSKPPIKASGGSQNFSGRDAALDDWWDGVLSDMSAATRVSP
jgi:hypothetical protein